MVVMMVMMVAVVHVMVIPCEDGDTTGVNNDEKPPLSVSGMTNHNHPHDDVMSLRKMMVVEMKHNRTVDLLS